MQHNIAKLNTDRTVVQEVYADAAGELLTSPGGNVASGATDSGNPVKVGGKYNATPPTLTDGQRGDIQLDSFGSLRVNLTTSGTSGLPLFTNTTSADAVATISGNNRALSSASFTYIFNGTTWDRQSKANNTSRITSAAATTNATSGKASAGTLYSVMGYNAAAAVRYLKLYNKATAPTVGTDTPVMTVALAPSAGFSLSLGATGFYFSTGIAFALTTGNSDADTGALTAGDILGLNVNYS